VLDQVEEVGIDAFDKAGIDLVAGLEEVNPAVALDLEGGLIGEGGLQDYVLLRMMICFDLEEAVEEAMSAFVFGMELGVRSSLST
jgi:hypothetical protein